MKIKFKRFLNLLLLCFIICLLGASGTSYAGQYYKAEVHYIDVGQGDSVLIESGNHYMLIDAGKSCKANIIINYLKKIGVKKLDYTIWTHPDADHIGGAANIIKTFNIGKVIMSGKTHTTITYKNLIMAIKNKGLKITLAKPGDEYQIGNAKFTITAPNGSYSDNNNSSVGLRLVNGRTSFLFIGDAEKEALNNTIHNRLTLRSTVLMAGHHGSDTSNTEEFINAVSPSYAVISVGADNTYGHPAQSTLNLFARKHIKVYRTDKRGTIVASSNGTKVTFNVKTSENAISTEKDISKATDVYITNTGTKYHLAGCRSLVGSKIKITLKEAKEKGYTPCKLCNPPQ